MKKIKILGEYRGQERGEIRYESSNDNKVIYILKKKLTEKFENLEQKPHERERFFSVKLSCCGHHRALVQ